jgi:isoamylase
VLLDFTGRLVRLRREHPELRRRKFFQGRPLCLAGMKDLTWLAPDGTELAALEWRCALSASGCAATPWTTSTNGGSRSPRTPCSSSSNARAEPVSFVLPDAHPGALWETLLDTAAPDAPPALDAAGGAVVLTDRSLRLFRAAAPAS